MKKLLKTDRIARLDRVSQYNNRKTSNGFAFSIGRRRCGLNAMISGRITYAGQDTGWFTLSITARWEDINTKDLCVIGHEMKSALLNDFRTRIERLFADCRLTGRPVDVFAIRDSLFADDRLIAATPNVKELIDLWLAYDQNRRNVDEIELRTLWKNRRWTNDFWAFICQKYETAR